MTTHRIEQATLALQLMDLTSLNQADTPATITKLCASANVADVFPAAVCVHPELVVWAKHELQRLGLLQVKVATVTNFPGGYEDVARAVAETERAVAVGADEVDVVFPYQAFLAGNTTLARDLIVACKSACGERALLKVILETGVLTSPEAIRSASELAIAAGADFIKTSTGKVEVNATLSAARIMLEAIQKSGGRCGFKAAGGVRTLDDAIAYLELARDILGDAFLQPQSFRFGASGLLGNLKKELEGVTLAADQGADY
ncbi:deoxyribose-phosphate aldolase [Pseudidiomarina sediminum]|uniref:Deoxyribose-phosphate aldolase n=1 Tax=Pseudidiomarina sediminum TaxID=431675 RepID=A0A432YZL7_9GAMM|nr:deoxyribose-phosphate aldolase [Pseudidiomarina sediminum]RUO69370.1 deoxyribose-phosphate aldolase [Pseudidiomarina sediminum]